MWSKLKLWWQFEARWYYRDFILGIKNLWKWFPTIWKDRDWDDHFIFEILKVKLENQAAYIEKNDRHVSAKRDAEQMKLCVNLIKLIQDDYYRMEYLDYFKEDYKFIPTDETKKWYTVETTAIEDNLIEYFAKYPRQYRKVVSGEIDFFKKAEKTSHVIALEIGLHNQEKAKWLLFKLLNNNIENWWE